MRAAIIFLLVGCAACVSATKYPNDWPQPDLADIGCPNISGTYTDAGLSASAPDRTGDDPEGDLSRYFFDYEKSEIAYTRISRIDENSMRVESFGAGESPLSRLLARDEDFTCRNGRLWVSERLRIVDDGLWLRGRERIGLALSMDGSLVGESRIRAAGRVFVIPILVRERDHILWELHASRTDQPE